MENNKTALLFGSSGLVGVELMRVLLDSEDYGKVRIFVRNKMVISHPKLEQVTVDFDSLDACANSFIGDDVFICLGTTMAKAGSKEAFYKVDHTYCYNIAVIAAKNDVKKIMIISSMGANVDSLIYYSKVKGEIERDISKLDFESVAIIRPSLLLGNRNEQRSGEKIFSFISKCLPFIYVGSLKKFAPIEAKFVAKAMLLIAGFNKPGVHIYESEILLKIGSLHK